MEFEMSASMVLVGAAIAIAGVVGVLQPPGHRAGVVLALAAGFGAGIAGLGLGLPSMSDGSDKQFWSVFFLSSVGGFATVMAVLFLTWRRARSLVGREQPLTAPPRGDA
jgi:drug/metabolite transporter (DMT)-like permease